MTDRIARDVAITAAKYGLALAAFAWLVTQIDVERMLSLLGRLDAATLAAVLAVSLLGLLGRFYSWQVVIEPVGRVSLREAGSITLVVNFVNQLLPSRLTGRVAAPFVVRSRVDVSYADAAAVAGVHTAMYAVCYGVVASVGLLFGYGRLPAGLLVVLALSTGLYLVAGTTLLLAGLNLSVLDPLLEGVARLATRLPRVGSTVAERIRGLATFADDSTESFRTIATRTGVWVRYATGWLTSMVLAPGVRVVLLLGAFGISFEPIVLVPVYLLLAYSVTLLPLTPGGIGITEATATAVFVALGVPGEAIVPVVLIDRAMGSYLPALAGWYPSLQLDLESLSTDSE